MKLDLIAIWPEIKLENDIGKQPLVSELWAIRGSCDEVRAKRIAKRSNLPLKWLDAVPSIS